MTQRGSGDVVTAERPKRPKRSLWRCPECAHRFVTKNLWHSCGRFRIADHFAGRPRNVRDAFDGFVRAVRSCGPVTVYAQKTRIVIQARVRFAGGSTRSTYFDAALWLKRRVSHPLLLRVESFGALGYGHHFRLESSDAVDAALAELIREAYRIGLQETSRRGARDGAGA